MTALARVWAKVKFFHPWLQYKNIDWDGAFVRALPGVESASTPEQLGAAVRAMLEELGDAQTRVLEATRQAGVSRAPRPPRWLGPTTLLVDLSHLGWGPHDFAGSRKQAADLDADLARAGAVIFDLRGGGPTREDVDTFFATVVDRARLPVADRWPSERRVQHAAYPSQFPGFQFHEGLSRMVEAAARPPSPPQEAGPRLVVFVVDARSTLPHAAIALQEAGSARIVAAGPMPPTQATAMTLPLAEGVRVEVRVAELVLPDGTGAVRPDLELEAGRDPLPPAIELAARGPGRRKAAGLLETLPRPRRRFEPTYAEPPLPPRELRVLAVVRLWAVIDHFYGYPQLLEGWDDVPAEFIPRVEAAVTPEAYVTALLEIGARIADGHVELFGSPALDRLFGDASIMAAVRLVEGKPVIVDLPEGAGRPAGIEVGDEIVTIGGEAAAERMRRFERYVSASTAASRQQKLASLLGRGPDGSVASLELRGADGKSRIASVPRTSQPWPAPTHPPAAYRRLKAKIGYVDLRTLTVSEVDPMFEALADTQAIIFDMRGYPLGTAWAIAPRLDVKGARCVAQFRGRLVEFEAAYQRDQRYEFCQQLDEDPRPRYRGRTFMLIDERAYSQAEHTALFFEATAGTTFVGSPTAGTDGGITHLSLPGGLYLAFTAIEVRHADGRPLQRTGIQPHLPVWPTIEGVRAGRDEVLEAAIAAASTP